MAVSSKCTQDLSVQIIFFTFSCKWFLCFYFWTVIWSYIVNLFAALHELASASARTLLKLASSVRVLLKPYGDTLNWLNTLRTTALSVQKWRKKLGEQIMGELPIERLKPAPARDSTALDFFGPFKVKDEVKKRTMGKAYKLIFNCLATRAVYVDVLPDYSIEKFLKVLRRFVSDRGYPLKLYSDNGAQIVTAHKEIKK